MENLTKKQTEALRSAVFNEGHRISAHSLVRNDLVRLGLGMRLRPDRRSIVRLSDQGLAVAEQLAAEQLAANIAVGDPSRLADEELGICPGHGERLNVRGCALILTAAGCAPLADPDAGGVGFRLSAPTLPRTVSVDVHPIAFLGDKPVGGWPAYVNSRVAVQAEAELAAAVTAALVAKRWQVSEERARGRVRWLRARPWGTC